MSDSLQPQGLSSARLLCPWGFPKRILEWVAISSCRVSSWPRDWIHASSVSWINRILVEAIPGCSSCFWIQVRCHRLCTAVRKGRGQQGRPINRVSDCSGFPSRKPWCLPPCFPEENQQNCFPLQHGCPLWPQPHSRMRAWGGVVLARGLPSLSQGQPGAKPGFAGKHSLEE